MESIPPQLQDQVNRLQGVQQRLEFLIQQKLTIEGNLRDTENAIQALSEESDDAVVYKSVGGIMLKVEKGKLEGELKEKKETLEMRLTTLEKQETRTKQQFEEMRAQLEANLKNRQS